MSECRNFFHYHLRYLIIPTQLSALMNYIHKVENLRTLEVHFICCVYLKSIHI